jgi:Spy/CpxP family protein refolding chaperone
MKNRYEQLRTSTILAVLGLLLGLVPALALAQPAGPPPPPPGPGLALEPILDRLNLTSQEQTAVDSLLEAHHQAAEAHREQMMAARKALHQRTVAEVLDEAAIRQAAAAVAALEADCAVADATLLRDIRAVLTAEHRAELNRLIERPMGRMDRPGRGGRGPAGPPTEGRGQ